MDDGAPLIDLDMLVSDATAGQFVVPTVDGYGVTRFVLQPVPAPIPADPRVQYGYLSHLSREDMSRLNSAWGKHTRIGTCAYHEHECGDNERTSRHNEPTPSDASATWPVRQKY